MPAKLKHGVIGAKGGKRKGAGRPTDKLLAKARAIGNPLKILQFYWDVANGKEMEQVVTDAGVSIAVPAPVKDRLRAGELYLDRVIGKVAQPLEHDTAPGSRMVLIFPDGASKAA